MVPTSNNIQLPQNFKRSPNFVLVATTRAHLLGGEGWVGRAYPLGGVLANTTPHPRLAIPGGKKTELPLNLFCILSAMVAISHIICSFPPISTTTQPKYMLIPPP